MIRLKKYFLQIFDQDSGSPFVGFDARVHMGPDSICGGIGQIQECGVMISGILLITIHGIGNRESQIVAQYRTSRVRLHEIPIKKIKQN